MTYQEKKFNVPPLQDISAKSVEEHLGLYAGYVKNFNAISAAIEDFLTDPDLSADKAGKNALAIAELRRRHSFEFDGMKLHELYFEQFEGGSTPFDKTQGKPLSADSTLVQALTKH